MLIMRYMFDIHMFQFLDALHKLSGYNNILFPHCKSDARKTGNIIMSIGVSGIALRACSEEGVKEVSHELDYTIIICGIFHGD